MLADGNLEMHHLNELNHRIFVIIQWLMECIKDYDEKTCLQQLPTKISKEESILCLSLWRTSSLLGLQFCDFCGFLCDKTIEPFWVVITPLS